MNLQQNGNPAPGTIRDDGQQNPKVKKLQPREQEVKVPRISLAWHRGNHEGAGR
jgi:hypothetical protein